MAYSSANAHSLRAAMMGEVRSSTLIERKSRPGFSGFHLQFLPPKPTSSDSANTCRNFVGDSRGYVAGPALSGIGGDDPRRAAVLIVQQLADQRLVIGVRFSGLAPEAAEAPQV